ncbi:hypothetical protein [Xanthomonas hortorum]|uniref:hypothetical protein n=1 Tax=Xanthomonas hortorum TaxID=56454 RepID=UPI002113C160|nr:hypothetical protein [Xanthomonas hortorum]UUE99396.1 hypothetical protein NDY24_06400 [Xanthomonas hortorum pv. pelargonii]UUF03662.1 hypothetical protein NDY25_06695 [Xanthomonas hortorum pv. pelargonii]
MSIAATGCACDRMPLPHAATDDVAVRNQSLAVALTQAVAWLQSMALRCAQLLHSIDCPSCAWSNVQRGVPR